MFSDLCPPPSRQPYSFSRGDNRESRSNSLAAVACLCLDSKPENQRAACEASVSLASSSTKPPRTLPSERAPRQTTRGGGERRRAVWRMGRWTAEELLRETLPLVDLSNLGRVVGKSRAQQRPLGAGRFWAHTKSPRPRSAQLSKGSGTHQSRCSSPAVVVASGGAACSFNQDGKAAP